MTPELAGLGSRVNRMIALPAEPLDHISALILGAKKRGIADNFRIILKP